MLPIHRLWGFLATLQAVLARAMAMVPSTSAFQLLPHDLFRDAAAAGAMRSSCKARSKARFTTRWTEGTNCTNRHVTTHVTTDARDPTCATVVVVWMERRWCLRRRRRNDACGGDDALRIAGLLESAKVLALADGMDVADAWGSTSTVVIQTWK